MKFTKYVFVLAGFVGLSLSAHAGVDENSSWDEISKARGYRAVFPMIQMDGVFVSYDGLCVSGENFNTDHTVERCVDRELNERGKCIEWEEVVLSTPRVIEKTVCTEWESNRRGNCAKWEKVQVERSATIMVDVFTSWGRTQDLAFSKSYSVPECN